MQPHLKGQTPSQSLPASTRTRLHKTKNIQFDGPQIKGLVLTEGLGFEGKAPKILRGSWWLTKKKKRNVIQEWVRWSWNTSTQSFRGKLMLRMFMDLWRREMLIGLWQKDPPRGRGLDHVTTSLALTAVASICTVDDLMLITFSALKCDTALLSCTVHIVVADQQSWQCVSLMQITLVRLFA